VVGGLVAALALLAAKAKLVAVLVLKFGVTGWTMALSAWAYSTQVGWPFAALLVGLILVHEIGHGVAARRLGVRVGAPVFIPFFGAFIALRDRPGDRWGDFVIAAGGPLLGGLASLGCLAAATVTDGGRALLAGCGYFALTINVFNLLPVWIFDGSKMLPAVRVRDGAIGIGIGAATLIGIGLASDHVATLPLLVLVCAGWQLATRGRRAPGAGSSLLEQVAPLAAPVVARDEVMDADAGRRWWAVAGYFGMIVGYGAALELLVAPR
jgi:Zn-dependent protease